MDKPAEQKIRIMKDGPYEVTGRVPLSRTEEIVTEYGEPVAWAPLEPVGAGRRYLLCRCGQSNEKPFCDDSHLDGFDGTEVADRGPRAERVGIGRGDGVVVSDDESLCAHAGYCGNRFTSVWDMIGETSDPAVREQMKTMVGRCPSGRLAWADAPGQPEFEPDYPPGVAIVKDGPIWVRGGIKIESEDGEPYETRNRVTLCRCGQSSNKPFCDGSHQEIGFREG